MFRNNMNFNYYLCEYLFKILFFTLRFIHVENFQNIHIYDK